jgi:hypothetical protein
MAAPFGFSLWDELPDEIVLHILSCEAASSIISCAPANDR